MTKGVYLRRTLILSVIREVSSISNRNRILSLILRARRKRYNYITNVRIVRAGSTVCTGATRKLFLDLFPVVSPVARVTSDPRVVV